VTCLAGEVDMARTRNRLAVKVFRLVEGEAEGPLAIVALPTIVILVALIWRFG
jgi:hypothetical protein